jgi:hypothetical protein
MNIYYGRIFSSMLSQNSMTKKTTKGDRHAMLKVIQHGVTIAKFWHHQPSRLGRDRKFATMGECKFHDVKKEVAIASGRLSFGAISGV